LDHTQNNQLTLTKGAQLDVEFTEGNTIFQVHSARLTFYNPKLDKSHTHNGNGNKCVAVFNITVT